MAVNPVEAVAAWLARNESELVAFRRDVHAHPELGRQEYRTTRAVAARLSAAGLTPNLLPAGTGLWCDIQPRPDAPTVMIRADIDALPVLDAKNASYSSTVPGVCHACGHDVHTAVVLGTGLALAEFARDNPLAGTVRLVFQPAEETMPGGALDVIDAGVLKSVSMAIAVHCDPSLDAGTIGLRTGPITSAADSVRVTLGGPGGHTSRPQNTVDLIYALSRLAVELPAALSRLVDPRSSLSLVWGQIEAGTVANAIPRVGSIAGTVRTLSRDTWDGAPALVHRLAEQIVAPYGASVAVDYRRGVPPVVNSADTIEVFRAAVNQVLPPGSEMSVAQSLGGEDFGWYLDHVPGGLARLGTRAPDGPIHDLHQGSFDVDEAAIGTGVRFLAASALEVLARTAAVL
ncbi:amidohydrolase [Frankia sp. Cppng1_Ct_nod]|uniref:amidohydrolase n=1 Tax=Frankia sp. Cppng1_Ct_nod TaxID=2897162 RepID=UPI001041936C|nr:amidohydrolase [Frankia sp. Cppng1_Ct_nod]